MHRHKPVPVSLRPSPLTHDAPTRYRCVECGRRVEFDDHGLQAPVWVALIACGFAVLWADAAPLRAWWAVWWPLVALWCVFVVFVWVR